jgi:hypothetical protein
VLKVSLLYHPIEKDMPNECDTNLCWINVAKLVNGTFDELVSSFSEKMRSGRKRKIEVSVTMFSSFEDK